MEGRKKASMTSNDMTIVQESDAQNDGGKRLEDQDCCRCSGHAG